MPGTISIDTETCGLDFKFGAKPYLVTVCYADGRQTFWEWDVDPLTREPNVPVNDIFEIQELLDTSDIVILQNSKFDAHALATIGISLPWPKVRDTLLAGHLLASNHKHDLTAMCVQYLGYDVQHFEDAVQEATVKCRSIVRRDFPDWQLAGEGNPDMPSVNSGSKRDEDKPWKNDMWLPRALVAQWDVLGHPIDDPSWLTVTSEYANSDSAVTIRLWEVMEPEIRRRGLWDLYATRLRLLPIACEMEDRGVTISQEQTDQLISEYGCDVELASVECCNIADQFGFDLELPKGAAPNDSIREFFYGSVRLTCPKCGAETKHKEWSQGPLNGSAACKKCTKKKKDPETVQCTVVRNPCLGVPYIYSPKSKSGGPTLDKGAMELYEVTLDPGPALDFIRSLKGMRSRQTAVSYMESYQRFWRQIDGVPGWYRLHPSMNPVGTDTLRWSSYNPNATNISKKADFNLRRCFGPAPGREWWSMDGKNLELRMPAYESGEQDLIDLFERSKEPPFYGSQHLLNFSVVYDDIWAAALAGYWDAGGENEGKKIDEFLVGLYCKTKYEDKWYQWVKNGDFAIQYNCGERTADKAFHRDGSYKRLKSKFAKLEALNQECIRHAEVYGYVETIPDELMDNVGYPILCSRRDNGRVKETTPLNYRVSGTAMQWTNSGMLKTDEQLKEWNAEGWDGFLTMQIHDEIVIDAPYVADKGNLPKIHRLQYLMEESGVGIGVPTPVSIEYHTVNWSIGEVIS